MKRSRLLEELASRIARIEMPHPVRVAIDGVDAAGKTTLADELVPHIQAAGRQVIRASVDGFHNPSRIRYRRGVASAEGYYHDSFDYQTIVEYLLNPLGPRGNLQYCSAVFDCPTDSKIQRPFEPAEIDAVLLFDGIFLHRPELREHWDFTVFVDASFEVTLARAMQRDLGFFCSEEELRKRYEERRYIPGQELYLKDCQPREKADVVVDNDDPASPVLRPRGNAG